jgi:DNA-binding MarR family transcriptional regulator
MRICAPELGESQKAAFGALLVAHSTVMRRVGRDFVAQSSIAIEEYDVLLALEDAPDGRLRMQELADLTVFSPSGLTRMVDRLVKKGWVRRDACPRDRRVVYAALTATGLAAREAAWPALRSSIANHFGALLSDAEAADLVRLLGRFASKRFPSPVERESLPESLARE